MRVLIVEEEPEVAQAAREGLRLDPFRRDVYRDGRYVPLTRERGSEAGDRG